DLERVLDNVLHSKDDLSWGPNNTFQFPTYGGTGEIWRRVADLVGPEYLHLNKEIVAIDSENKRIQFRDGSSDHYDQLISTLPIDRLVQMAGLNHLTEHTDKLKYSTSHIVG